MILYTIFYVRFFRIFSGKIAKDIVLIFAKIPQNWRLRRCLQVQLQKKSGAFDAENRYTFFHIRFSMYEKNVYFPGKRQHTDIRFFHT